MFKLSLLAVSLFPISFSLFANEHQHAHHSEHNHNQGPQAPISIMGEHLHTSGDYMVTYRYMQMKMSGLLQGDQSISLDDTLNNYMMAPDSMDMGMHMLGLMYAPSDDITLMLMVNYLDNEMDSVMRMSMPMNMPNNMGSDMDSDMNNMGMVPEMMPEMMIVDTPFSTSSSGMGDSRLSVLLNAFNGENYRSHFTVGLTLPTGDIDQTDRTPMNDSALLGYPMQLGGGTYNALMGFTWVYSDNDWQVGSQFNYETALETNDQHYKVGDELIWHNWLGYSVTNELSVSVRVSYTDQDNISGQDERLNPMMMPTADANMRGYTQIDGAIGMNYLFNSGALAGHRLALEWITPIDQDVDGIQMEIDWSLIAGWQYAF